jgi:hypothetical protein
MADRTVSETGRPGSSGTRSVGTSAIRRGSSPAHNPGSGLKGRRQPTRTGWEPIGTTELNPQHPPTTISKTVGNAGFSAVWMRRRSRLGATQLLRRPGDDNGISFGDPRCCREREARRVKAHNRTAPQREPPNQPWRFIVLVMQVTNQVNAATTGLTTMTSDPLYPRGLSGSAVTLPLTTVPVTRRYAAIRPALTVRMTHHRTTHSSQTQFPSERSPFRCPPPTPHS